MGKGRPLGSIRILMFAPWFPPHRNSEAHVTGKLALSFLRRGCRMDVVSSPVLDPLSPVDTSDIWKPLGDVTHAVPPEYPDRPARAANRIAGLALTGHPVRGISWVKYAIGKGAQLARSREYDLILSRSQPPEGHLPAMILASRLHLPWIANWNDIEPAILAPEPYGRGLSARTGFFFTRYIGKAVAGADHHTFPSARSLKYIATKFPGLARKASVIPHLALEQTPAPPAGNQKRFTLCHAGSFDGKRDPSTFFRGFLDFVGGLKERGGAGLVLLGNSSQGHLNFSLPPELEKYVTIMPWTNYQETLAELARADVLLIVEAPLGEGIYLPGKLSDYIQAGRPILSVSPRQGTLADLLGAHGGGIAVDCRSPSEIRRGLDALYESWRKNRLAEDYRTGELSKFCSENSIMAQYEDLFEECLQG